MNPKEKAYLSCKPFASIEVPTTFLNMKKGSNLLFKQRSKRTLMNIWLQNFLEVINAGFET